MGNNAEWWTPRPIVEAQETVQAARWIGLPADGLTHEWHGRIWLNPPWSEPGKWAEKLLDERDAGRVTAACMIGPLSGADWVQRLWREAELVCWIRGCRHTHEWGGPAAAWSKMGRPWSWGIVLAMWGGDPEPLRQLGACR